LTGQNAENPPNPFFRVLSFFNHKESQMESVHVFAMAGSLRERSFNRALLRAAAELLPDDMSMDIYDIGALPPFNSDLEAEGKPESVQDLHTRLAAADALLVATPEYNWSIPGVLKNAIDWASRGTVDGNPSPLNSLPMAIIGGAGGLGGVRAQDHLRQIVLHNDVRVLNRPQYHLASISKYFDDDLKLIDEDARERLAKVLVALRDWTQQLS